MADFAYFKDGHQEEILAYSINETRCGVCSVRFYTPSGEYMYQTAYLEIECRKSSEGYLRVREHIFSKYHPEITDWLRCDIEKITITQP